MLQVETGNPHPLGATVVESGVNFALYAGAAEAVELCLFDRPDDARESSRIRLPGHIDGVWHGRFPGLRSGQLYGYRVHGRYAPREGLRFNSAKLLLDPYARLIHGLVPADDGLLGFRSDASDNADEPDRGDSAGSMPKCVVTRSNFDWRDDRRLSTPWDRTVIYECHVKGMTMRHPEVEPEHRGRYLGLASRPIVEHLLRLGVTAVELLPIQYFVTERHLSKLGLHNYWGYNTIGFFAPDPRYATAPGREVDEFKAMVQALHKAGIEVILDVVYNHTAEGDERGPTLAFRGIDNAAYYHLEPGDLRRYRNYSGCGNSLNTGHPAVRRLVLDSLRYWVEEMHVDGFRFDLAPTLCRGPEGVDERLAFFDSIRRDSMLSDVKLIVEPWDAAEGGFLLGKFPPGVAEWNCRFRDDVRRFWRGDAGQIASLATRLAGSSDVFDAASRGPGDSVNFVTCHDGFTLHDLAQFGGKHNEANGENNRDGPSENFSRNWGVEGPTLEPAIGALRERVTRSLLATLAFSQGVPMLTAGDEMGRTQRGNNNAYCQDNEISWLDWNLDASRRGLLEFVCRILALRREHPILRRRRFFTGRPRDGADVKDIAWFDENGVEMTDAAWSDPERRTLVMLLDQTAADAEPANSGGRNLTEPRDTTPYQLDGRFLALAINGGEVPREFRFPSAPGVVGWSSLVNTSQGLDGPVVGGRLTLAGHSLAWLTSTHA